MPASRIHITPKIEPLHEFNLAQQLRIRRFWSGAAFHLTNLVFILLCLYMGYLDRQIVLVYTAMVISVNLIFYCIIHSGFNQRFSDPSLTFVQILIATLMGTFVMSFAGEARATFLMLGESMFIFGAFRFRSRDFLLLAVIMLVGYALTIWFNVYSHRLINLNIELLQFIAFVVATSQLSYLGSLIVKLRRTVGEKHKLVVQQKVELEDALRRIHEMAIRDELTGAYNRRHAMERLNEEFQRSIRNGPIFSIAMIDVDYFKSVNDNYGHPGGDAVLQRITRTAMAHIRPTDIFARYGGEEFIIIMPGTSARGASLAAERIRKKMESLTFPEISDILRVTISIGVAEHSPLALIDATLRLADGRLYQAKQTGRNTVVWQS